MYITCRELRERGKAIRDRNFGTILLMIILANVITGVASFVSWLLVGPLMLGIIISILMIARGGKAEIGDMFKGFDQFVNSFLAYLLMSIYVVLWSLIPFVGIVLGMIAYYKYQLTLYILADNPNIGANEAITKSKELMDGYKGKKFLLDLSFIGWILLTILTFGILAFWVLPHIECTNAAFYLYVKEQKGYQSLPKASDEGSETDSFGEPI